MAFYEVPLSPSQRSMTIPLGAVTYRLRFYFADAPEGGWSMDISDAKGNPILCGAPLVEGADILGQYAYLGVPGRLWLTNDEGAAPLSYDNLGLAWHLLFEPNA